MKKKLLVLFISLLCIYHCQAMETPAIIINMLTTKALVEQDGSALGPRNNIFAAVYSQSQEELEAALQIEDPSSLDLDLKTPLHIAAMLGWKDGIDVLLNDGRANINATVNGHHFSTPLIFASAAGNFDSAECIAQHPNTLGKDITAAIQIVASLVDIATTEEYQARLMQIMSMLMGKLEGKRVLAPAHL